MHRYPAPCRWRDGLARPCLPLLLVLLCNIPGLALLTDIPLNVDPDTGLLIREIRRDPSPRGLASWFTRDWPLQNRFYRPLVVLSLAADNALWGDYARGYRLTSWLLACATAWALFWWLAAFSGSRAFALLAAVLFSLRQSLPLAFGRLPGSLPLGLLALAILAGSGWVRRHGGPRRARLEDGAWLLAALLVLAHTEWRVNSLIFTWIAARTALLGALFGLLCLGALTRYLRRECLAWGLLTLLLAAAALASYEQAVMLPLAAAALMWPLRPRRAVAIRALAGLLLVLMAYLGLRALLFEPGLSAYQQMQLRSSLAGPVHALLSYALPPTYLAAGVCSRVASAGAWSVFDPKTWRLLVLLVLWLLLYLRLWRQASRAALALLLLRTFLFLPMAALHPFDHYYYLPETAAVGLSAGFLWPAGLAATPGKTRGRIPAPAGEPCMPERRPARGTRAAGRTNDRGGRRRTDV